MKRILKKIIRNIVIIFSYIFTKKMSITIDIFFNLLYTFWHTREFRNIGESVSFAYPLYLKGGKYISVGTNVGADQRLRLDAIDEFLGDKFTPEIIIGDNVSIQKDCHIGAIDRISIGNNVLLASKVYISDHFHGEITKEALLLPPAQRKLYSKGPIIIEDNVWLGEGVVVLPGVTIGKNSIVGANAVVTKSIPKNCVAGGNPARIIREIK
ncbi:acyltransferase [Flavobacterium psychroterrae]|uniref:Acyltransferase n=1 Tax=Flavobacterium psychroterrae TaxID=2133767 RepID=A0ABS5PCB9_9FLAO|nr:acyltransferase [Flavobacterium psychroterrae]MBS7231924.1 acyltransferase [Flavobacterium psychroterrae]